MALLKKILIFLFILSIAKGDIYQTLAKLLTSKTNPLVAFDPKKCDQADILFLGGDTIPKECFKKPIIVTNYRLYRKYKDRVVGAFFYLKGRPQILLSKKGLGKYAMKIPKKYAEYIDE